MPINSWVINRSHLRAYRTSVKQTTTYPGRFVNPLLVYLSWSSQSPDVGKRSPHVTCILIQLLLYSTLTFVSNKSFRVVYRCGLRHTWMTAKAILRGFSCRSSMSATPESILLRPLLYFCPTLQLTDTSEGWIIS